MGLGSTWNFGGLEFVKVILELVYLVLDTWDFPIHPKQHQEDACQQKIGWLFSRVPEHSFKNVHSQLQALLCECTWLCCLHPLRLLLYNFLLLFRFWLLDLACVDNSFGFNFLFIFRRQWSLLFNKAHLFFFNEPFLKVIPELFIPSFTATFNHTLHHRALIPLDPKCKSQNATLRFWFTCDVPILLKSECIAVRNSRVPCQHFHSDCLRRSFEQFHVFLCRCDLDKGVVFYLEFYIHNTCFKHLLVHVNCLVICWICPRGGRDFFFLP